MCSRSRQLKYLVPRLVCCFLYSCTSPSVSAAQENVTERLLGQEGEDGNEEGSIAMGPMTLREYVNTLEPYNPWVHGWRGEEPRRVWKPTLPPPTPQLPQKSSRGKSQSASGKNRRHAHK